MIAMYRVTVLTLFMWTSNAEVSEITVKSGADVTLPCQGPRDEVITLLEWNRSDLKADDYVFLYRNGRPYEPYQDPSFGRRVQLMDPQIKNGDVSVILKNVNINDTGTYECRVSVNSKESDLINTINLKVEVSGETSGGDEDGNVRGHVVVGLTVVGVIVVVAAVFIFMIHRRKRNHLPPHPPSIC